MEQITASPIQNASNYTLVGSIALCVVGYAVACMHVYNRTPRLTAMAAGIFIACVFIEGLWNGLRVNPIERLAVVMPTAVNVGLTWGLYCQRSSRWSSPTMKGYAEV